MDTCQVLGCMNIRRYGRKVGDRLYRGKFCERHHSEHYGMLRTCLGVKERYRLIGLGLKCDICGWDKDRCDFHRKINGKDGGTYKRANIISLCPNCHRLVHSGKIIVQ